MAVAATHLRPCAGCLPLTACSCVTVAPEKISSQTVRADFNDPAAVVHYARAAHFLGLWESERRLIERFFPDKQAQLLEAGCGAGRVTIGLWDLGYRHITAFDFAEELLEQARSLVRERGAEGVHLLHADATRLTDAFQRAAKSQASEAKPAPPLPPAGSAASQLNGAVLSLDTQAPLAAAQRPADGGRTEETPLPAHFHGALFMFNGLMQIPGRENRRAALRELALVCRANAPLLFTTHDRNVSARERLMWRMEADRWATGRQDPRLVEFGDRYFEDETGRTFMHLPDRDEILADLAATGWERQFDALRREIAPETRAVVDFSDECRFWVARKVPVGHHH